MKTYGKKGHQYESGSPAQRRNHGKTAAADKIERCGNENDQEPRQLTRELHKSSLKAVQTECVAQKIIEDRIDDAFGKADHGDARYKQQDIPVSTGNSLPYPVYHGCPVNFVVETPHREKNPTKDENIS
jgi:hypothetical protein